MQLFLVLQDSDDNFIEFDEWMKMYQKIVHKKVDKSKNKVDHSKNEKVSRFLNSFAVIFIHYFYAS